MSTVKTTRSLWNHYRDETNNSLAADYNADPIANSECFKYKSCITGKTSNASQGNGENTKQGNTKTKKNLEIAVPLRYLSNFCRHLDVPLINYEVFLTLTWFENCVLFDITPQTARAGEGDNPARPAINAPANATFRLLHYQLKITKDF